MKLRNKRTGNIADFCYLQNDYIAPLVLTFRTNDELVMRTYNSLAELNDEWEDYQEPKDIKYYYCISMTGDVHELVYYGELTQAAKDKMAIGNYFETREEAERAVGKLKAWKMLMDNGIKFKIVYIDRQLLIKPIDNDGPRTFITAKQIMSGLELLFGGSDDN